MKKISDYYKRPTHPLAKKIGDSIMTLGTMITAQQIYAGNHTVALIALGLTWTGKTLSNLFSDTTTNEN